MGGTLVSTVVLVVVFAGLVGYIYFVDSKHEPGGHGQGEAVHLGCRRTTSRRCRSRALTARPRASRKRTASGNSSSRYRRPLIRTS